MEPIAPLSESRRAFAALKAGLGAGAAAPRLAAERVIPTGLPALDRILGGGFPRGALVAVEGEAGRWSLAARLLAQVTQRALAAIVDDGGLYPPSLARAGVRLDRVLIACANTPLGIARAADILLRSRACRLVLMPAPDLRPAVWSRLATLAHRTGVLLIAITARAAAPLSSAAALRLDCILERLLFHGTRGLWCTFSGYELRASVRKYRHGAAGAQARLRAAEPLAGVAFREREVPHDVDEGYVPSSAPEWKTYLTISRSSVAPAAGLP